MKVALHFLALVSLAFVSLTSSASAQCGPLGVTVTVNPPNAAPGQPITVTLANNSNQLVQLPSSCVIASISTGNNCIGGNIFTPFCLAVITPVPAGQSVSMVWNQLDNHGANVLPGGYSAEVVYWDANFTNLTNCCIPFTIGATFSDRCFGDGGNQNGCTNCPCGNNAPIGTGGGCLNSAGSWSRLQASGSASVSSPMGSTTDLRFALEGAPPGAFCILNSGDALAPGSMMNPCFGLGTGAQALAFDGLRCAIANTRRHGGRSADANGRVGFTNEPWGGEGNPFAGIAPGSGFLAGQIRYFQVINRDDALAVCMRGLNTSQAIEVTFAP